MRKFVNIVSNKNKQADISAHEYINIRAQLMCGVLSCLLCFYYTIECHLARMTLNSPLDLMTSCCSENTTRTHNKHTNPSTSSPPVTSDSSCALTSGFCLRFRTAGSSPLSPLGPSCGFWWFWRALVLRTVQSLSMFTAAVGVTRSAEGQTSPRRAAVMGGVGAQTAPVLTETPPTNVILHYTSVLRHLLSIHTLYLMML